jgi:hypothetical protein
MLIGDEGNYREVVLSVGRFRILSTLDDDLDPPS